MSVRAEERRVSNELADAAILIVDDRPENLVALEAVLQPFHHRLVRAISGDEALKRLLETDFAAILLDIEMPGLDGFQTAKLIRERERTRNVPILFLTAAMREEADLVKAYAQGTVDYIVKPIDTEILRAKVGVLLELHARGVKLKRQEALRENAELEREAARAEADYQQQRLHSLFMNAPFPLAIMKGSALIHELVNPPYRRLFGNRELIDKPLREALADLDGHRPVEIFERVFRTGEAFVDPEFPMKLDRSGTGELEESYFNIVVQPVRGPSEDITGVLAFGSDVTDQVLARRKVEDAVRVRDDFLSIASHELKTPLTPLELKVTSLLRQAEANLESLLPAERVARELQIAQRQIRKMTELINELLDDSRISAGRLQLSIKEVNLSNLVQEVVARFHQQAVQAGCSIDVGIVGEPISGRWDPLRIEQVITNLLTNALKYGAGKPIHIRAEGGPSNAKLTVQDQGIGIPREHQSRIFDRFERAVTDQHFGGMGLGLYITRKLVAAHGGQIEVESEPGKGSTFTVELPRPQPGTELETQVAGLPSTSNPRSRTALD